MPKRSLIDSPSSAIFGQLDVRGAAVGRVEDVDRARFGAGVVVGTDHDGIAGDRHGVPEAVVRSAVRGSQLGNLAVRGAVGRAEDVGRARLEL